MRNGTRPSALALLPGALAEPPDAAGLRPHPATIQLVRGVVRDLLLETPSYAAIPAAERRALANSLVRVGAYAAELMRDAWWQAGRLDQVPLVRRRQPMHPALARAQSAADSFRPAAAGQIARVARETLKAIAFPEFVQDLIRGTFDAITKSSIQELEAYMHLLENVGKTVEQFMGDNISDDQARDWLHARYPEHIRVADRRAVPADGADERPLPDFRTDLGVGAGVSLDEDSIEETLVPAARRRLAQSRLEMLSTLVLMGMNRIVVTGGKIRATMGLHIDTTDRAHEENASDFDFRSGISGSFGYGPWSVAASMSVAYVTSTRASSDAEINVDTDLTAEVELHFKTEHLPLERFARGGTVDRIRSNTAVPEANEPVGADAAPFAAPPSVGGDVGAYRSPRTRRSAPVPSSLPPLGKLPEARLPVAGPLPPPERRPERESAADSAAPTPAPATSPATPPGADTAARTATPANPPAADTGTPAATPATPPAVSPAAPARATAIRETPTVLEVMR